MSDIILRQSVIYQGALLFGQKIPVNTSALAQVFSCEFCEIFRKTFFYRTPPVAASVQCSSSSPLNFDHSFEEQDLTLSHKKIKSRFPDTATSFHVTKMLLFMQYV